MDWVLTEIWLRALRIFEPSHTRVYFSLLRKPSFPVCVKKGELAVNNNQTYFFLSPLYHRIQRVFHALRQNGGGLFYCREIIRGN